MVIALVAAVAVVVFGAQSATAAQQTPQEQQISLLFAQTANRGQMTPIKGTPRFHLKLFGVHPQVVWFSDRPARESGTIPVRRFALSWAGFGFLDEPPNAALTVLHTGKRHDTVIVKLGQPRFERRKHMIRYTARRLDQATGDLSSLESDVDPRVRRHFHSASLFIDDATGQVVNGCLIEAYTKCPGADLHGADLYGVDLHGADLSQANLTDAIVAQADVSLADLPGAELNGADLTGDNLRRTDLRGASLVNTDLPGSDLSYANLIFDDLHGADLSDAALFAVDLSNADLSDADLSGADLSDADLSGADLSSADLTDAKLHGARFCQTKMPDGSTNNRDCQK
jgi:uncharacterized protein YjbI with pentapeptide repeats